MRIDARNLLDRLGRNEFAYKEFEDRFTDLELWPILEALLRDPRLQTLDQTVPETPAVETAEAGIELAAEPLRIFSAATNRPLHHRLQKQLLKNPFAMYEQCCAICRTLAPGEI